MARRKSEVKPITRQLDFTLRAEETSDGMTLTGLAVPFNVTTRIDSYWEGTFDEQFAKGAFKRTIKSDHQVLQFNHGFDPRFGELPIGEILDLTEADRGLEVEARMFAAPELEWMREAVASGAITGMSIRFRPMAINIEDADNRDNGVELRTITEADLRELGPVVFPAYPTTEVDLRSLDFGNMTRSEKVRLHEALAVDLERHTGGDPLEPSTGPARPTASNNGPTDNGHPSSAAQKKHRQRRALIAELEGALL